MPIVIWLLHSWSTTTAWIALAYWFLVLGRVWAQHRRQIRRARYENIINENIIAKILIFMVHKQLEVLELRNNRNHVHCINIMVYNSKP